ncbi:MAG: ABC transporter transmembrane domain-containing protein [Candidatus Puniceispirillales bacterium]
MPDADVSTATPPQAKGKLARLAPLRALWPWIRPYRLELIKALGAIMLVAAALLSLGRGIGYLVDSGLSKGDTRLLDQAVLICIGITVMLALGSYLRTVLINKVAERIIADIRKSVFRHTIGLSTGWFEQARIGDVISTLTVDTTTIQTVVASSLSMAMRNILVLIGGIIMVLLTSPKLTLIVFAVIPLVIVPVILIGRRLRRQSRLAQDALAEVSVEAEETLTAISTVQAFAQGRYMESRFNAATEGSHDAAIRRLRLRGQMSGIVILLVFSAISFILWVGGKDLLSGAMSAGDLSAFVFYAALVASSVGALSDMAGELQRAAGAAERIAVLLAEVSTITTPKEPKPLPQGPLGVQFRGVDFSYPTRPDLPALTGIDLAIEPSERVALVGPSGAGKSTMLGLILRLFDPVAGQVMIGGIDARSVAIEDLRGVMGLVPQETALFSGTIADNIRFGRPDADHAALREAAISANADGFIRDMPEGYDTPIGEKGVRLSGGQRQRIAIARALLRDPAILLLDEATSSLDAQSEQAVQLALATLMQGRTTVVIAHRLSTVLNADRIVVMNGGRIEDIGTHDELLTRCPLYHDLASLQLVAGGETPSHDKMVSS